MLAHIQYLKEGFEIGIYPEDSLGAKRGLHTFIFEAVFIDVVIRADSLVVSQSVLPNGVVMRSER